MWNSLSLSLSGEERRRDQSIIREIILRYIMLRYNYNYKQTYKRRNYRVDGMCDGMQNSDSILYTETRDRESGGRLRR